MQNALVERIQSIRSCRTPKQFEAAINRYFIGECDEFLGDWRSKWRRVRNELETVGLLILRMAEQAEREHQSLLVLGI
ncbi:MAG: hypothetical protein ABIY70_00050 [Capsulimonas sp.]|uniref:hypothetical protein n=1 Tax=Capsulimonas sp. TaxID=2494211 RepID=UPI0032673FD6